MMKFAPWFKKTLYLGLTASWLSGLSYFIMNQWISIDGEFGPEKHPWQYNILMIHGAFAFFMLMVFGSILSNHLPKVWRTKRLRKIGVIITTFIIIQAITAYLLYYMASEDIRGIASYIHLIMGLCLPLVLIIHIILGKKRPIKPNI